MLTEADPKAAEWLEFGPGPEGQTQFALKGFRPLEGVDVSVDEVEGANDPANPFPPVTNLLTVEDDFGSWSDLSEQVFRRGDRQHHQDHRRLGQGRVTGGAGRSQGSGPPVGNDRLVLVGLGLGIAMLWFSVLVLIPLTVVVVTATEGGWAEFSRQLTNPQTAAAIRLTVGTALAVTVVNVVMGTVIVWVLVRDDFFVSGRWKCSSTSRSRSPTIVAGGVAVVVRAPQSGGRRRGQHAPVGGVPGLPVRDPAVRGARRN